MHLPNRNGFTLVEVLVVVTILMIISATVLPTFSSYIQKQNLNQSVENLLSDIRSMENKAISGVPNANGVSAPYWGIYMPAGSNTYTVFSTLTEHTSCTVSVLPEHTGKLTQGATFANTYCIYISTKNGALYYTSGLVTGSPTILIQDTNGNSMNINYSQSGLFYVVRN